MTGRRGELKPLDVAAYNLVLPDMCELLTSVEPFMPKDGSLAKFAMACVHVTFQQTGKLPSFKCLKKWIIARKCPHAFAVWPTIKRILQHHGWKAVKPIIMGGKFNTLDKHPMYNYPFGLSVTEVTKEQIEWLIKHGWSLYKP